MSPAASSALVRSSRIGGTRADQWFVVAVVVAAALHLWIVLLGIYAAPVGFDEAYVVQAPWNLVSGNGYATFDWFGGETPRVFDKLISTGPVVLLPVAASFLVFGVGIVQVRWAMVPFYGLFLVVAWLLGRRIAGRWAGLASVISVLALNLRYDLPYSAIWSVVDGLGEIPAVAFLLMAVLLLPRSPSWAGIALGIAALCKVVVLIAVPAFVIACVFFAVNSDSLWKRRILGAMRFGLFAAAPSVLWEVVKFVSTGWPGYLDVLKEYASFLFSSGSGLDPVASPDVGGRIRYLAGAWYLPWPAGLALVTVLIVLAALWMRRAVPARPDRRAISMIAVAGGGTLATCLLWWIAFSDSFFARHVFPGLLLIPTVLLAAAAGGCLSLIRSQRRLAVAIGVSSVVMWVVVAGWQTSAHIEQAMGSSTYSRSDQQAAASYLAQNFPDGVQHIDYWSNPELRLMSGVDSMPYPGGSGPLVLSPQMEQLAPVLFEEARALCRGTLFDRAGFLVCVVDQSRPTQSG